jgi:hypothetical protein
VTTSARREKLEYIQQLTEKTERATEEQDMKTVYT